MDRGGGEWDDEVYLDDDDLAALRGGAQAEEQPQAVVAELFPIGYGDDAFAAPPLDRVGPTARADGGGAAMATPLEEPPTSAPAEAEVKIERECVRPSSSSSCQTSGAAPVEAPATATSSSPERPSSSSLSSSSSSSETAASSTAVHPPLPPPVARPPPQNSVLAALSEDDADDEERPPARRGRRRVVAPPIVPVAPPSSEMAPAFVAPAAATPSRVTAAKTSPSPAATTPATTKKSTTPAATTPATTKQSTTPKRRQAPVIKIARPGTATAPRTAGPVAAVRPESQQAAAATPERVAKNVAQVPSQSPTPTHAGALPPPQVVGAGQARQAPADVHHDRADKPLHSSYAVPAPAPDASRQHGNAADAPRPLHLPLSSNAVSASDVDRPPAVRPKERRRSGGGGGHPRGRRSRSRSRGREERGARRRSPQTPDSPPSVTSSDSSSSSLLDARSPSPRAQRAARDLLDAEYQRRSEGGGGSLSSSSSSLSSSSCSSGSLSGQGGRDAAPRDWLTTTMPAKRRSRSPSPDPGRSRKKSRHGGEDALPVPVRSASSGHRGATLFKEMRDEHEFQQPGTEFRGFNYAAPRVLVSAWTEPVVGGWIGTGRNRSREPDEPAVPVTSEQVTQALRGFAGFARVVDANRVADELGGSRSLDSGAGSAAPPSEWFVGFETCEQARQAESWIRSNRPRWVVENRLLTVKTADKVEQLYKKPSWPSGGPAAASTPRQGRRHGLSIRLHTLSFHCSRMSQVEEEEEEVAPRGAKPRKARG